MEQTDSSKRGGGGRGWLIEGEGVSQRSYMNDPWTWTTVQGLTGGAGVAGWEGAKGGNWDNYNSINNMIFKFKKRKVKKCHNPESERGHED